VSRHADAILAQLRAGTMPCDSPVAPDAGRSLPALGGNRQTGMSGQTDARVDGRERAS
jgi:hypothetical protein